MCVASVIYDYARNQFPRIDTWPAGPQMDYWKDWLNMLDKAKEFDKKNNESDCEDPEKVKILEKILKRLDELEIKINNLKV